MVFSMSRLVCLSIAVSLALLSVAAQAAPVQKKPKPVWHGYGFLPGYVPPEQEPPRQDYFTHPPTWWYGGPGFYRGRWNGGGFGPCWTQTPIGPMWNCG